MSTLDETVINAPLIREVLRVAELVEQLQSAQYRCKQCPGCGGEKQGRKDLSFSRFEFDVVCGRCNRRLPKDLRDKLRHGYGKTYSVALADSLDYLSKEKAVRK